MRTQVHLPFPGGACEAINNHRWFVQPGPAFRTVVGLTVIALAVSACDPQTRRAAIIGGGAGALGGLAVGAATGVGILGGTIIGAGIGAGAGAIYANRGRLGQTLNSARSSGSDDPSDTATASGLTESSRTAARRSAFANTAPQGTAAPIVQNAPVAVAQAPAPTPIYRPVAPTPTQAYFPPAQAGGYAPPPSYIPQGQQAPVPAYAAGGLYAPQPGYVAPGAPLPLTAGAVPLGYAVAPTPVYPQQAYQQPAPLYTQPNFSQTASAAPFTTTGLGGGFADTISRAQSGLARLGYDPGPANRIQPALLEAAVRKYQGDNSMPVTGQIDEALVRRIDEQSGRSAY